MNLQKILFPEMILGRRVPSEHIYRFYKAIMDGITFEEKGVALTLQPDLAFLKDDTTMLQLFLAAKRFVVERPPIYHICNDFTKALMKLEDREIPTHYIKDFFGYISFPSNTVTDGVDFVEGAFVYVGPADKRTPAKPDLYGERILWYTYICKPRDQEREHLGLMNPGRLMIPLKPTTVHELMAGIKSTVISYDQNHNLMVEEDRDDIPEDKYDLTLLLINTLLYLSSQDPELMKLTPTHGKSKSQRKHQMVGEHVNSCTLPVIAINWNYRAPKVYHVDETAVESHFRWQRCGPNFSEIKLILVKEHVRHYKKELPND